MAIMRGGIHAATRAAYLAKLRCEGDAEAKVEAAKDAWDEVMEGSECQTSECRE